LNFTGTAPKVKVIPIRFIFNQNQASLVDELNSIDYLIEVAEDLPPGARLVANNSWGGFNTQAEVDAFKKVIKANVVVVSIAGNCGPHPFSGCEEDDGIVPPWDNPELHGAITVGAVGWKRNWDNSLFPNWRVFDVEDPLPNPDPENKGAYITAFSSRAHPEEKLDIMAPGNYVSIPTIVFQGEDGTAPGNSDVASGTSFAAPHVAGAAALLLQKNPNLTSCEVECILKNTALLLPPGDGDFDPFGDDAPWGDPNDGISDEQEQGSGLLQVDKALEALDGGSVMNDCQQQCLSPEEEL
jgi:subtilisin family serine protease